MATGGQNFRNGVLPLLDRLRGLPVQFGLRPHVASVRIRSFAGERVGLDIVIETQTGLKVGFALGNVKVRNVTQKDIIASGGLYTDQDLVVGPITPPFPGSVSDNNAISIFEPPVAASATEILFNIQGPGYAPGGDWFKKIGQRVDQSFRYMLYLQKTGQQFS